MRTAEQRDEQTVAIATSLLWFALVIGLGIGVLGLLNWAVGISDDIYGAALLGVTVAAGVLAIWRLGRRRDRRDQDAS